MMEATFVIIGGGIAGVSCCEALAFYNTTESILIVSESALIKTVTNLLAITQALTQFDIGQDSIHSIANKYPNVSVMNDVLEEISSNTSHIALQSGSKVRYKYLCLCMGAIPKLIQQADHNPCVVGIRDTDSVEYFLEKLKYVSNICVVGNGGIASELVHKIQRANVDWVIKDKHITSTFVDAGAAEFFQSALDKSTMNHTNSSAPPHKQLRYEEYNDKYKSGAALGPDWYKLLQVHGALQNAAEAKVIIHYECEIESIQTMGNLTTIRLTNGITIESDIVVSATGVTPKTNGIITDVEITLSEHGYAVNEFMQTSITNIYAAGDVCTTSWQYAQHWFPMKLWTQARQMGAYAAKCMASAFASEMIYQDFCFEIFTHSTKLFGYKVILLGLYNGQKLDNDYQILLRVTRGVEYVKLILKNGRLQGAVLIGETDLEETCENLILNQLDLSSYKEELLNPDIDIEDYFD